MAELFYSLKDVSLADVIPFYHKGTFRLFYLLDWRDKEGLREGTHWYQISTMDFVQYTEHGEMLARGSEAEQDLYVFTGRVIEQHDVRRRIHIFFRHAIEHVGFC